MNKMVKKKSPDGADIVGGIALMVTGVATRAAPLIILGGLLVGKGAAALRKKAAGDDAKPLSTGFVPVAQRKSAVMEKVQRKKAKVDIETPQHAHLTDTYGQFDPVSGYYLLPEVTRCVCPKCGTVTDTSRRFCYKCDTDLKKAHGG